MLGKVTLVGAGPGDPGLLTLKGAEAIKSADVVLYDRLVGAGVLELIPDGAKRIDVGKRCGSHRVSQDEINRLLLDHALDGKNVVRLKGGDSFVFGRGGEELELLQKNGVPFEVVPGITSAVAVPAYAGIPVTHRGTSASVHIVTAHTRDGMNPDIDFKAYAGIGGTLIFLMGAALLSHIVKGLMNGGMDIYTPCAVIEHGTKQEKKKVLGKLNDIEKKAGRIESPAIIIVGGVCELSEKFDWYSRLPLHGKTIAVTRHENSSSGLSSILYSLGAEVIECPCIHTEDLVDGRTADQIKRELKECDTVAFTSANGVRTVMEVLKKQGCDARVFGGVKIAAIGGSTAGALSEYGINADIVPGEYSGRVLGTTIVDSGAEKVLLLRAENANREIDEVFKRSGIGFTEITVYRTVPECEFNMTELINEGKIDYVTFTSGSTVEGFMQFHKNADLSSFKAVCIGGSTAEKAARYGMECMTADHASLASMAEAIVCDAERGER